MQPSNTLAIWQIVISGLVGILTIISYFLIANLSGKNTKFNRLDDELNNIVNTWVKYPQLEDDDFISRYYSKNLVSVEASRYDAYCTLNFNFLESLYKHFSGNKTKIRDYCEYEEIIITHYKWWNKNQSSSVTKYTGKFGKFIDEVVPRN